MAVTLHLFSDVLVWSAQNPSLGGEVFRARCAGCASSYLPCASGGAREHAERSPEGSSVGVLAPPDTWHHLMRLTVRPVLT